MAFSSFYRESKERLEGKMKDFNAALRKEEHPMLTPFMSDFADLNEGGKMLRGVLVNLGSYLAGCEDPTQSDSLALAFELFQTGVLVHDDVIDHAQSRRGNKTIHRRYEDRLIARGIPMVSEAETPGDMGVAAAICVGDMGLYYANREIAATYRGDPRCGSYLAYFDQIILDTIRGELLDVVLPAELMDPSLTEKEKRSILNRSVMEIYHLKTSCYSVVGPLHLGMLTGSLHGNQMEALDRFADCLGVAYQIEDDILGIYGDENAMGKDVGSDVSEYKQTVLFAYVRTKEDQADWSRLQKLYGKEDLTRVELEEVRDIFKSSGALAYALELSQKCYADAEDEMVKMSFLSSEKKELLRGLIASLRGRSH